MLLTAIVLAWGLVSLLRLGQASDAILRENYRSILAAEKMRSAIQRQEAATVFLLVQKRPRVGRAAFRRRAGVPAESGEGQGQHHDRRRGGRARPTRTGLQRVPRSLCPVYAVAADRQGGRACLLSAELEAASRRDPAGVRSPVRVESDGHVCRERPCPIGSRIPRCGPCSSSAAGRSSSASSSAWFCRAGSPSRFASWSMPRRAVASGDYDVTVAGQRSDEFADLADHFNTMVAKSAGVSRIAHQRASRREEEDRGDLADHRRRDFRRRRRTEGRQLESGRGGRPGAGFLAHGPTGPAGDRPRRGARPRHRGGSRFGDDRRIDRRSSMRHDPPRRQGLPLRVLDHAGASVGTGADERRRGLARRHAAPGAGSAQERVRDDGLARAAHPVDEHRDERGPAGGTGRRQTRRLRTGTPRRRPGRGRSAQTPRRRVARPDEDRIGQDRDAVDGGRPADGPGHRGGAVSRRPGSAAWSCSSTRPTICLRCIAIPTR